NKRQIQLDKLYSSLKDLSIERRQKLEQTLKLYRLNKEIDDLEKWISHRESIAGAHESGQDFEYVSMLLDRFVAFEQETQQIGNERLQYANNMIDNLISNGHIDSAQIAELKDSLDESYQDLLELIETRLLALKTSWELHKFLHDCKEILLTMEEHTNSVPDEIGRDQQSVQQLLSRDLQLWMNGIIRHMNNSDKPHDVSGVDLLMNNHQSLKAEIDSRQENFIMCINLGKDLINRQHVRSSEVKEKCIQLSMLRDNVDDTWKERWKYMQLILGQLGETLDQVQNLIKRHEQFEKSLLTQEDRFNALRKVTTLEKKRQLPFVQPRQSRLSIYLEEFKTWEERNAERPSTLTDRTKYQSIITEEKTTSDGDSDRSTNIASNRLTFYKDAIDLKAGRAITDDVQLESSTNVAPAIDYRKKTKCISFKISKW
ncbi:unnamed protein product, partial [Rotaria sp. Silwood1]